MKTKINKQLPIEARYNYCVNRFDLTPKQRAIIREQRHREMIEWELWKEKVIMVGSFTGVAFIWLIAYLLGVFK